MRLFAPALALCLVTAVIEAPSASAAPTVLASFELDPAPSWQSSTQKAQLGSWVKHSSPVVVRVGGDPTILVGSLGGKLYALRYDGGSLTKSWDSGSAIGTFIDSSPAVGDLNGDGCPEVVVGAGNEFRPSGSGVHVFDCRGRNHRHWPTGVGAISNHVGVFSTPAIGDVNGDGSPDVTYGSFDQKIYAKNSAGSDLPGWPRQNYDTVWSSPALADIDGGGREVVIGTDLGGGAAVLGCAKETRGTMSIFHGDANFTPNFPRCLDTPTWSTPAVQDLNGDGTLDVVVGTNNYGENLGSPQTIRAWDTRSGRELWHTSLPDTRRIFASPAVGDVGGDGSLDVAVATLPSSGPGSVFLLDAASGRVRWQRQGAKSTTHFMGSPVLADVSGDAKPDVVSASLDGALYAWDGSGNQIFADLHARDEQGRAESYQFANSPAIADVNGDGRNDIVVASAVSGSNPLRGKVWVFSTPGRGEGPWPFYKRSADRISSVGRGVADAPIPAASVPVAPKASGQKKTKTPATARPTSAPVETDARETNGPLAVGKRAAPPSSGRSSAVGTLAALLTLAAGVSMFVLRRRVSG